MAGFDRGGLGSDASVFRGAFGRWATGVAVATCAAAPGAAAVGLTINSLTSVSLDPPLALFCIERHAQSLPSFLAAPRIAINILSEDQADVSTRFAQDHRLSAAECAATPFEGGAPVLPGVLAALDMRLRDVHGGGDHDILICEVLEALWRDDASPLLYVTGDYRAVRAQRASA